MPTPPLALRLIEEAYEAKAEFLDLGNCGLTEIPEELGRLGPYLTSLSLGDTFLNEDDEVEKSQNGGEPEPNQLTRAQLGRLKLLSPNLSSLSIANTEFRDDGVAELAKLPNLTTLDVSNNQIGNAGTAKLAKLTNLITLNISSNEIGKAGAAELAKLTNLTTLHVSSNKIGDIGAAKLANLTNLTSLNIRNNWIWNVSGLLSKLTNLTTLDVSHNRIGESWRVGNIWLAELPKLTSLNISYNYVDQFAAAELAKLTTLTTLDVSFSRLWFRDAGAAGLAKLTNLTTLNVSGNEIGKAGAAELAKLTNLTTLDVSNNKIGDIGAAKLGKLTNLITLNISGNEIGKAGAAELAKLTNLTTLDVSNNKIGDVGAARLAYLTNLTNLRVRSNQLKDAGAAELAKLTNLTTLEVGNNWIGDAGAAELAKLTNLATLDVGHNGIGKVGAAKLAKLTNLTTLDVSGNEIGDAGAVELAKLTNLSTLHLEKNAIRNFPIEAYRNSVLGMLTSLRLKENPIKNLPIFDLNSIRAIRGYIISLQQTELVIPNSLLKISLLGDAEAGKTSFAEFLVFHRFLQERDRTHGIQQYTWLLENGCEAQLWDFGGQDFYHGTHHLFLRDDTLYLVFWHPSPDTEKELLPEAASYRKQYCYWLGNTRYFAKDATLLVVENKGDLYEKEPVAREDLRTYNVKTEDLHYLSIQGAYNGQPKWVREWKHFVAALEDAAQELAQRKKINANWPTLRTKLLVEFSGESAPMYLEEANFWGKSSVSDFPVDQRAAFLSYLEYSGTLLRFPTIELLRIRLYFNPERLLRSIYAVFDEQVRDVNKGQFDRNHVSAKVGPADTEAYLELMSFYDLIFKLPGKTDIFVVPQYLPDYPLEASLNLLKRLIPLTFALHYPDYLHKGLIFAFIAQYGSNTLNSEYWRYGLHFEDPETKLNCLVYCDVDSRYVFVHCGESPRSPELVARIFGYFANLNEQNSYHKTRTSGFTQEEKLDFIHSDSPEKYGWDWRRLPPHLAISSDGVNFMDVRSLIQNLSNDFPFGFTIDEQKRVPLTTTLCNLLGTKSAAAMPKKVFFSYSHKDEVYRNELETHFAALRRSGKIESWQDRQILPGQDWDATIAGELRLADIVLLLLSSDFLNSDYIWKKELGVVLERRKRGEKVDIVPIFLRPCDFDLPGISEKQGIPRDANGSGMRWILSNHWTTRDEAYLEVVRELKKLLN